MRLSSTKGASGSLCLNVTRAVAVHGTNRPELLPRVKSENKEIGVTTLDVELQQPLVERRPTTGCWPAYYELLASVRTERAMTG